MTKWESIKELEFVKSMHNKGDCFWLRIDYAQKELERLQKKEIPMKPEATLDVKGRLDFICPNCNRREIIMKDKYCCNCGQRLSWE